MSSAAMALPPTADINVAQVTSLVSPRQIKIAQPLSVAAHHTVLDARAAIGRILDGSDKRMLAVVGPCSIHDEAAAVEYAERLAQVSRDVSDTLLVVMRVYFEKPRTTTGWKGLINDPHLDGSFDMEGGITLARRLLLKINDMGLPAGTEMLDPITPQYIADLVSWVAIGARTIESQTHRQMASGLSMPVGYKNATDGDLQTAIDAMKSSRSPHSFLGIDDDGRTAVIKTRGNKVGHLILRGGRSGPNFSAASVADALTRLSKAGLPTGLMVDCSHANSSKQYRNQAVAWKDVIAQRKAGNRDLTGLLVESNLNDGNQPFPRPVSELRYGVSITDECIGWEMTQELLLWGHEQLKQAD